MTFRRFGRPVVRAGAIIAATAVALISAVPSAGAAGTQEIIGSGSSWAFNAVNQWISDVSANQGLKVVFTPTGSARGRTDFAQGVVDFAVSDIGYQGNSPGSNGDFSNRAYAYLPIVGGGTAFPYNITVGGQRVENLRLSGLTLAKIFTDQITNWDDPEITADNNGHALPSIPIIPVVHSEGAGTTYQFTDWLYGQYPTLWENFTQGATGQTYNYPTEFWPTGAGSQADENGSDGVMSFITSGAGQGSIGFDEYSYALGSHIPVVALENTAGYFTMPDAYDVAVSLTQSQINMDSSDPTQYLLEKLDHVWTYTDPRTYPLSSYSYLIEPTGPSDPSVATTTKAQALINYVQYSICQGQREMAPIGYSPLPINLVQDSQQQLGVIQKQNPRVDFSRVNVQSCGNPTFDPSNPGLNYLAEIAPQPPACAKAGQGPCPGQYAHNGNPVTVTVGGKTTVSVPPANGPSTQGSSAGSGSASSGSTSGGGAANSSSNSSAASSNGPTNTSASGPTGTTASSSDTSTSSAAPVAALPTALAADHPGQSGTTVALEVLALLALLAALAVPPYVVRRRNRQ